MLEQSWLEAYNNNGYVVMKQLFSPQECAELKAEVKRVLAEKKVKKDGVYLGMSIASGAFKEAAAKAELAAALRKILGEQVVFLSDKVVCKGADVDFGSPWHQDYPYWKGSHKLSVWIALDEATPENGCLRVCPGSHRKGALSHGGDASDGLGFVNRLKEEDIKPDDIVDLPAGLGDAIIFHDLLFHASYPNKSGKDRVALISTYKDGTQEDPDYPWSKGAFPL